MFVIEKKKETKNKKITSCTKLNTETCYKNNKRRNRRNNDRSYTRHRGEQHRYDRKPKQHDFSNLINFQQASSNHANIESEEIGDTHRTLSTETRIALES